jgi:hypothetical protein
VRLPALSFRSTKLQGGSWLLRGCGLPHFMALSLVARKMEVRAGPALAVLAVLAVLSISMAVPC